jgi:hypothetical protein
VSAFVFPRAPRGQRSTAAKPRAVLPIALVLTGAEDRGPFLAALRVPVYAGAGRRSVTSPRISPHCPERSAYPRCPSYTPSVAMSRPRRCVSSWLPAIADDGYAEAPDPVSLIAGGIGRIGFHTMARSRTRYGFAATLVSATFLP